MSTYSKNVESFEQFEPMIYIIEDEGNFKVNIEMGDESISLHGNTDESNIRFNCD